MTDLAAGQQVGKYRIVRELGRGGMGVVYLATDESLDREVALKLLHPALSLTPDFAHRFRQEARAIASLSHPHIVDIHALENIDGRLLIDVRYLEGGSLTDRFAAQVVTVSQLVRWCSEILGALGQCHLAGVIHRDVKPANILFDAHARALLSDFGLAKAYSKHVENAIAGGASSGFFLGSPRYAPPEAWNDASPAPCWDVYSLGIVMYEAISGSPPYDASTPLAILNQIVSKPLPPLPAAAGVSPGLTALVNDMVHRDPARRPHDGAAALERLLATPEYEHLQDNGEHTVVIRKSSIRSAQEQPTAIANRKPCWWRIAAAGVLGVALVAGALYARFGWPGGAGPSALRAKSLVAHDSPTAQTTVAQGESDSSPHYSTFNVSFPDDASRLPQTWYIGEEEAGQKITASAVGASALSVLTFRPGADATFEIQGDWAEYLDSGNSVLRYGSASGHGRWLNDREAFIAWLHCTSDHDGATQDRVVSGVRTATQQTDTRLIAHIEAQPNLAPLLYNELMPRNLTWAAKVEESFPALQASRANAPLAPVAPANPKSDTELLDSLHDAASGATGNVIAGWPATLSPSLRVLCSSTGLYLGFETKATAPASTSFEVAALRDYYTPVQLSPDWKMTLSPSGVASLTRTTGADVTPAPNSWKARLLASGNTVRADVFIPFSALARDCPSSSSEHWRINARTVVTRSDGHPAAETFWGHPNFDEPWRGAVVVLGPGLPVKQGAE